MGLRFGKFQVSGAALVTLVAVYFFDTGGIVLPSIIAIAVHELGHYIAIKAFRREITCIQLNITGLVMMNNHPMSYMEEIISAAAGPAASIALALGASFAGRIFDSEQAYLMSGISLILCLFNLLPVYPLDGGRIEYALAAHFQGPDAAEKITVISGCVVIFLVLAGGAALFITTKVNFTLLLVGTWLLISYCKKSGRSIKSIR
jgi:stage IV sporulation protein FB